VNISLRKEFRFEASHQLPNHDGKCARLHGHSWVLTVWVTGPVSKKPGDPKEGMVVDYAAIKKHVEPIVDRLDHHHLGNGVYQSVQLMTDIVGFDVYVPTSENILRWIADRLQETPLSLCWTQLDLDETCTTTATLTKEEYDYSTD
jgi:6-pyruvoyltetrahydropterin/6-carboxytetrahydropterin synthase